MQPTKRFVFALLSLVLFAAISGAAVTSSAQTKVRASDEAADESTGSSDDASSGRPAKRRGGHASYRNSSGNFMNIRVAPLGLLIGYVNFDFDFKVAPQWTIGPTVTYWQYNFQSSLYTGNRLTVESRALGVRGTWAANGAFESGLYVTPMIQFLKSSASGVSVTSGSNIKAEGTFTLVTGLVGYQWYGQNFNINLGGGIVIGGSSAKIEVTDGTSTTNVDSTQNAGIAIDFMVGYAF